MLTHCWSHPAVAAVAESSAQKTAKVPHIRKGGGGAGAEPACWAQLLQQREACKPASLSSVQTPHSLDSVPSMCSAHSSMSLQCCPSPSQPAAEGAEKAGAV